MADILKAYAITLGWALVGSIGMGLGIVIALKLFTMATRDIDEWALIKSGNVPMGIILAAIVLAIGIVISSAIRV